MRLVCWDSSGFARMNARWDGQDGSGGGGDLKLIWWLSRRHWRYANTSKLPCCIPPVLTSASPSGLSEADQLSQVVPGFDSVPTAKLIKFCAM